MRLQRRRWLLTGWSSRISRSTEFNDRYKLKRRSDFNATALLKAVALVENQRYICVGIRNNKLCEYDPRERLGTTIYKTNIVRLHDELISDNSLEFLNEKLRNQVKVKVAHFFSYKNSLISFFF